MRLVERFWTTVTYVVSLITFSEVETPANHVQSPILPISSPNNLDSGPVFKPPTGTRGDRPGVDFMCNYTSMVGWEPCSSEDNRGCWLRETATGKEYNISTNYEFDYPKGIHRYYSYSILDGRINADGIWFDQAKLFNGEYPGPYLQACWGDTVTVTVYNKLAYNGTSVHWHGIRQNQTMHMDGVNGVTQCPIAPKDKFVYTWKVIQYGTSWYHSHYSAQYADGVVGPMTLHGPSTDNYDEAKFPILMTDWGHNSAFEAIHSILQKPSILLNGRGNVTRYDNTVTATDTIPGPEEYYFTPKPDGGKAKRYLMRLINTSFQTTFVFSIDHHWLTVVGADFVPIHPYKNTTVLVGIGQRYHVIVTADPEPNDAGDKPPSDGNFWIRTWRAECFRKPGNVNPSDGYERTGILRYDRTSKSDPTSNQWMKGRNPEFLRCSDETYKELKPFLEWKVGPPVNARNGNLSEMEAFDVQLQSTNSRFPLARFSMAGPKFNPLQISYANPTFLHLSYDGDWPPLWAVFPEDYKDDEWIYMVIKGSGGSTIGAHPIHLHGHDFAILEQREGAEFSPDSMKLKTDNPPRRDVVLLPVDGYVVIAFKADNPGVWLVHCHIASHASEGLGMIIMERQKRADEIWPIFPENKRDDAIQTTIDGCNKWNKWWGDCCNWYTKPEEDPCSNCHIGQNGFADDSGI